MIYNEKIKERYVILDHLAPFAICLYQACREFVVDQNFGSVDCSPWYPI
jgi:hypothetical protein